MSSYRVPVANGTYNVNLEFAETYLSAAGQRVFDVGVGGQTLANLDVFAQAGGNNTALLKSFANIPVGNGVLRRVERVEWSSNLHQLPALRLESRPDRAVGQLGMLVRLGVGNASVEQPGV